MGLDYTRSPLVSANAFSKVLDCDYVKIALGIPDHY